MKSHDSSASTDARPAGRGPCRGGASACLLASLLVLSHSGVARGGAPPAIGSVLPRGGQRGTDVVVTFSGARLDGPQDVLCHQPGISVVGLEPVDANNVRCTLRLAADCALGPRLIRLRTLNGVSNANVFSVSNLPEIQETEPNNVVQQAQPVTLPACINGVIPPEDVDVFAFSVEAGQTLAFEIEALRLGDALFDPRIALLDANGVELAAADDVPLLKQDAALVHAFATAGMHFVQVRETAYGGGGNFWYRLHAGAFPRPRAAMPCGGQAGTGASVRWIGDPTVTLQEVTFPVSGGDALFAPGLIALEAARDAWLVPTPVPFRVVHFPAVVEVEPNNAPEQGTPLPVPGGVSGVIEGERDVDHFVFDGIQGQTLEARVFARRLGSPLDAVIGIRRLAGSDTAVNDDAAGPDSVLRWTCQASDKYVISIRDLLFASGPDYTYFLEIAPPKPGLTLTVSSPQAAVTIPAGNRAALVVTADRADFGGPLSFRAEGLPPGVSLSAEVMSAGVGQMALIFEACADAPPAGALVNLIAEHTDPATGIRGELSQALELIKYDNNPFFSAQADRLAVAVAQPAPFSVEIVPPAVPIVRNGSLPLPVRVHRAEGFTGHVSVRLPWNPPGIGSGALELPGDKSEGFVPLNAAGNAAPGEWKIAVIAATDGGGAPLVVASALTPIRVADPFVEFAVQKARTEQGQPVDILVNLTHKTPFEGEARIALYGLPGKTASEPLAFTGQTTELRFPVTVGSDAPPGEHAGVFAHAEIPFAGQLVAHNSPPGQLIIDKPLPPRDPAAEAARADALRHAQEEKDRKQAERLAAIEARRKQADAKRKAQQDAERSDQEKPDPQP